MPWAVSNMDVVTKNVVRLVVDSRNGKENQSWKKKYGRVRKVINILLWKVRLLILIQLKRKSKNLDYQGTNVIHLISSKVMLNSRNIKKRLCQYYRFGILTLTKICQRLCDWCCYILSTSLFRCHFLLALNIFLVVDLSL